MKHIATCPVCDNASLTYYRQCIDYSVSRESFTLKKCPTCQLLITEPQPENEQLEKYYQFSDYVSHTSNGSNLINKIYLLARRYTLRKKLNLINRYLKEGKLLDIGCGTGNFLKFCKENGWDSYGVEPSDTARAIAIQNGENITASIKQIKHFGFDVITLWHVLEHLPNLNEDLFQIKTMLGDNGIIFIAVPNYESYDASRYEESWAAYDVPRHLWHFTKETMQELVLKHGLKLVGIEPMKLDAYYVSLLSEKYLHQNNLSLKGFIRAIRVGLTSNWKAKSKNNYSSLIYIIKK
jgi:2-polyprenyl-3-methyl-5-hydroxy-6-metoxy-1,4-benzoquinol methylase